jgi:hypothetical protein
MLYAELFAGVKMLPPNARTEGDRVGASKDRDEAADDRRHASDERDKAAERRHEDGPADAAPGKRAQ